SVAGSIGLLIEHQRRLHGTTRLRASTIKGLILHTADEAGPAPGPDYMHGWGLMNTGAAAKLMQEDADGSTSSLIREEALQQDEVMDFQVYSPGRGPMKVTICWTDPAGPVQSGQVDPTERVLVNDLDLRIVDPFNAAHLPWVLDASNPQADAVRGDNIADNVEQVFIASPAEGFYTVRITHKGSLQGQQQIVSIIASVSNAPALMSPPSGLTELSLTPALQWSPARGATGYDVQVARTPEFKSPVIDATGIVDAWYTPGGLQRLENYYWRVRARDAQGTSDWSDIWRLETGSMPSRAGHALYFDGFDDAAVLPHRAAFDAIEQQDAVTVEAWINIRSWQDGRFPVLEKYDAASDRGWSLQLRSNGRIEFTGTSAVSCNFSPQLDTWYHIAVSYARAEGKIRFFVDGARRCEVNYADALLATGDGALHIGASPSQADNYAHGVLDEVRVWVGARSEAEINAQMFSALSGTENGLAAVLHCDDGRGLTAAAAPGTGEAALRQGPAWLVSSVPMTEPPVPVLLYPGQNSANIPVQPQLRWMAATSAMHYRVQISAAADFSSILFDRRDVTATEIAGPTLQAETEYWWRANAENPVGSSDWSVPHRFTTAVAPPPAPKLVSPRDATADLSLQVTLLWEAPARAQRYHVQVSADSLFERSFVLDRAELISPTAEVKDLGNYEQYYWRVRASNFGGSSGWSETWRFTTLPAEPEAPLLIAPAAEERGLSLAPQFTWESVASATTYAMQLAEDSAFTSLLLDVQKIPFTRYAASNLQ
ncbi:MAG: LamG-like jellyroll fold domain-containing protein, partial [Bacteroidota bacterium]|nr:LamG-like jellyroll fold domain-containing protein [Bacteroidota bacterium]